MKNTALILLLGNASASEANTVAVASTNSMAKAVAAADLDLKEFATNNESDDDENSSKQDEEQLRKNHGRDKNGMFKNHKNFVMMRNKIND